MGNILVQVVTIYKDRGSAPLEAPSESQLILSWLFYFGIYFAINNSMHYVYLLYSDKIDKYYIGQTNNLKDRVNRHNQNRCRSTKNKGPWILIGYFNLKTRSESVNLERKLKNLKNRKILLAYFNKKA